MREEIIVGKLRHKHILVDAVIHLLRHIIKRRSLEGVRGKYYLCVGIIADDACHHSSHSVAIGVHMHYVLALAQHACQAHRAVEIADAFEWQNRHRYVHLLELLDDVIILSTHNLDIVIWIMTHSCNQVTGIAFGSAPSLTRHNMKNINHDIIFYGFDFYVTKIEKKIDT